MVIAKSHTLSMLLSGLVLMDPLPIGSHVMKPERYPDPKKMVDELA